MSWVKKGSLFLIILFVLLFVLSQAFLPENIYGLKHVSKRNRAVIGISQEPENSIQLLIVGDSESYTSVSTMQLWKETGIPTYICGQPGQRISETYYIIKKALETQNPRVIMIETNLMYRYNNKMKETESSIKEMIKYYFPVFMYHDMWKAAIKGKEMARPDYKGFQIRTHVKPYNGGEYMHETTKTKKVPEYVSEYFDKIIELCNENGVEILLYSAPSPKNYNYMKHNGIAAFAKQKNISYVDLNLHLDELHIDWSTDSCDSGDHLNVSGAHRVNEYMNEYLVSNYNFADMRADKRYSKWNEMQGKYEKRVKTVIEKIRGIGNCLYRNTGIYYTYDRDSG
ncbi:MAG: SGNH/GDSL hydrolase family protein [Bacillota bacterium]|nr:SGNH/GDSL hydrolase family protein [Bacillota bacterium]